MLLSVAAATRLLLCGGGVQCGGLLWGVAVRVLLAVRGGTVVLCLCGGVVDLVVAPNAVLYHSRHVKLVPSHSRPHKSTTHAPGDVRKHGVDGQHRPGVKLRR